MSTTINGNALVEELADVNRRHYFDNDEYINPYESDVTCLSAGTIGPCLLKMCVPIFEEATKHRMNLEKDNAHLFQYGTPPGDWKYRDQLSKFLTRRYGEKVNRQDFILTGGATLGLVFVLNTLLSSDGIIFVEETTYGAYFEIFKIFPSMKVVSVPMNDDGVDIKMFEEIVACEKSKRTWELSETKIFWAMFYTMSVFHNPTGITATEKCCKEVVRIARKMNILVMAEDIYNLLYYGSDRYPPRRLFTYDRNSEGFNGGNVISSGTFSKILAPGIRVGWIEAGPRIVKILTNVGLLRISGAVSQYMSGILASVLELGLMDTHMEVVVSILKQSMSAVCDVLDEFLPASCKYRRPDGSFFIWIQLPQLINADEFITWCTKEHKVNATPGYKFSLEGKFRNYMRITTAFYEVNILKEGTKRLCSAVVDYLENQINL